MTTWGVNIGGTPTGYVTSLHQELSSFEICRVKVPSTPANQALVASDQDTTITVNGTDIFVGYMTGPAMKVGTIDCKVYNKIIVTLNQTEFYSANYTSSGLGAAAANVILAAILSGTGITVGECPTTSIEVQYIDTPREKAAIYIAQALGLDWWTDEVSTFSVGVKGGIKYLFKCDEGSGTALYDATANGEEGALLGGATWVAGKFGTGINLVSGSSQRIESGVIPGTLLATGAWSFVFFVKAGAGETGCVFGLRNAATGAILRVDWDTNAIRVRLTDDAAVGIDFTGSEIVADSAFHEVEVVVDPASDEVTLYVDGVEDAQDTTSFGQCAFGAIELMYGCYNNNGTPEAYTDIVIDELMWFDVAHNPRQARALGGLNMVDARALDPNVLDELTNDLDRAKQKNYMLVLGVDSVGTEINGQAYIDATTGQIVKGAPPGGFSYKPSRRSERSPSTVAELNSIAAGALRNKSTDVKALQIPMNIDDGYDIYTGDYVVAEDSELALGNVYRVYQKDVELASVTLALDKVIPGIESSILSLKDLEDLGIYPVGVGQLPKDVQGWGTSLACVPGVGAANNHNSFEWAAAKIKFADGDEITITAGNKTGLPGGTVLVYYVKSDENPTTLYLSASYDDLDAPNAVPVLRAVTPPATDLTQYIELWPLFTNVDTNPVIGTNALSDGVIITPDFRTGWDVGINPGSAGIAIFSETIGGLGWGIFGYAANAVKQFYLLASNGKAYFAGGKAIIDTTGITINDTIGDILTFKTDDGLTTLGWLQTRAGGWISLTSNGGARLSLDDPFSGDAKLHSDSGDVFIQAAAGDIFLYPGNGKYVILERYTGVDPDPAMVPRVTGVSSIGIAGRVFAEMHATDFYGDLTGDVTGDISGSLILPTSPADDVGKGVIELITAGEALSRGEGLYMAADGDYNLAKADAEATMPCTCVAIEDIANAATGYALFFGKMRDDGAFAGLNTEGSIVFVSKAVAGAFVQVRPAVAGDLIQQVGEVKGNQIIGFTFDNTFLELA